LKLRINQYVARKLQGFGILRPLLFMSVQLYMSGFQENRPLETLH
jgi:hypothetical protein